MQTTIQEYTEKFNVSLEEFGYKKLTPEKFLDLSSQYVNNNLAEFTEIIQPKDDSTQSGNEAKKSEAAQMGENTTTEDGITGLHLMTVFTPTSVIPQPSASTNGTQNKNMELLWGIFAATIADSSFDRTSIPFPERPKVSSLPVSDLDSDKVRLYLFDDTKVMSVTVPAFGGKASSYIYGKCTLSYKNERGQDQDLALFSTRTSSDAGTSGISLYFPSALKLNYQDIKPKSLALYWKGDDASQKNKLIVTIGTERNKNALTLVRPSKTIKLKSSVIITDNLKSIAIVDKDKGSIRLYVKKMENEEGTLVVSVTGARLESSSDPKVATVKNNTLKILKKGSFTIMLANLVEGGEVSLELSSEKTGLSAEIGTLKAKPAAK